MDSLPFIKMHGLGNDFVVIDARRRSIALGADRTRRISDRHFGVGCDQVIVVEPPVSAAADAFMRVCNADGGEVAACGNAARCVAALLMREKGARRAVVETAAGRLDAEADGDGLIRVDLGPVRFDWRDIPLSRPADTLHLNIEAGPLKDAVAVSVGNPHAVFFVEDVDAVPLERWGPTIETHPLFPEGTNVEAARVLSPDRIRLRVWERGTGLTRACGTGACAALVAANRRGLTGRRAEIVLDGGTLRVEWRLDGRVVMTGPVATSFTGVLDPSLTV